MKRFKRLIGLSLALCLFTSVTAFAETQTSASASITLGLYKYTHYSRVGTSSSSTTATTNVSSNKAVAGSYMGAQAFLYNSNGSLVKSGSMVYCSTGSSTLQASSGGYTTKGTFYSQGKVHLWNGNGYNPYTCNRTPNVSRNSLIAKPFEINSKGLTYGSNLFYDYFGETPDLILVEGISGVLGYVKSTDLELDYIPNNLEEAIDYTENYPNTKTIPVYDAECDSVIDTFVISNGNEPVIE